MKTKSHIILALILLACAVSWTTYGQTQNPPGAAWEYTIKIQSSMYSQGVDLGALGAAGWELTAVTTHEEMVNVMHNRVTTYYFKRRK